MKEGMNFCKTLLRSSIFSGDRDSKFVLVHKAELMTKSGRVQCETLKLNFQTPESIKPSQIDHKLE